MLRILPSAIALPLLLTACSSIWNARDLAVWVRDRAAERGCQREMIELAEWYVEEAGRNIWHGTCRDARGNAQSFGINIDPVWKPSNSAI
jgi:hypothetical protein